MKLSTVSIVVYVARETDPIDFERATDIARETLVTLVTRHDVDEYSITSTEIDDDCYIIEFTRDF